MVAAVRVRWQSEELGQDVTDYIRPQPYERCNDGVVLRRDGRLDEEVRNGVASRRQLSQLQADIDHRRNAMSADGNGAVRQPTDDNARDCAKPSMVGAFGRINRVGEEAVRLAHGNLGQQDAKGVAQALVGCVELRRRLRQLEPRLCRHEAQQGALEHLAHLQRAHREQAVDKRRGEDVLAGGSANGLPRNRLAS